MEGQSRWIYGNSEPEKSANSVDQGITLDLNSLKAALISQREDFLLALQLRLQTPVRACRVTLHDLLEGEYGIVPDSQRSVLTLLAENSREIERLITMLVNIYRYRNGKYPLRKKHCKLSGLLSGVESSLTEAAKSNGIDIKKEDAGNVVVYGDAAELRKLLIHLLDNAVKYARSTVRISTSSASGLVEISVEDDGPGIAPDDQITLFDRFHHMSTSGQYAATTGVGLCLCSEITKAHSGTITCSNSILGGARFTVSLPEDDSRLQNESR